VTERSLTLPIDEAAVRELRVSDILFLTGRVFTARDEAHRAMLEAHERGEGLPFVPEEMALFHCGPIVRSNGDVWKVIAAGPTTSDRMEIFEDRLLEAFAPRILVGKGGMGDRTLTALKKVGAVYAHYTGGAGALAARQIERVEDVHWLEKLGMPEAVWILEVREFGPLLVTMDSRGESLYKVLESTFAENMRAILARIEG